MSGEPQWKADVGSVKFLLGIRDNNHYTDDYREIVAKHHGYGSWQALMDDGLADAEASERTHCSECGRPFEPPPKAKARELGTGELGSWKPEFIRAVDALRELDWAGFDPTDVDDLVGVADAVMFAFQPPVDFADALPPSQD